MGIQMIILSNIGNVKERLSVSSKQFPQSIKISADSVSVFTPFLMSACMMVILNNSCIMAILKCSSIAYISYYKTVILQNCYIALSSGDPVGMHMYHVSGPEIYNQLYCRR